MAKGKNSKKNNQGNNQKSKQKNIPDNDQKNSQVSNKNNNHENNHKNDMSDKVNTPDVSEVAKKTNAVVADKRVDYSTNNTAKTKAEESQEPAVPMTRAQKVLSKFDIFGDLFVLNIFFFVTCLPIVTIGASLTAMYTVTNKMVKNEDGPIKDSYFKAFKSNFKQATAIWLIDLAFIVFVMFQYNYYLQNDNQLARMLFIFMGFEFILMAFAFPLQFPMLARYDNTTLRTILNSLILAMTHLGVWFRMFFIWMFPVALYYLRPNLLFYTWYLWGMILSSLFAYVCSMFLVRFYDKIESMTAGANESQE